MIGLLDKLRRISRCEIRLSPNSLLSAIPADTLTQSAKASCKLQAQNESMPKAVAVSSLIVDSRESA
jgi:hypothetical protein